jgi:prepilin-type N-terminal cleavage/methylation domain-containing protein/prepilin-type processing-associated H-X9-DG protein
MKTSSPRRSSAFTLVELLVVIGILAVLISLLLPVLSKMRESAKQVTCSGNLRSLGQAMIMYASDNDGYLPATSQGTPTLENPADWIWWQPDRLAANMNDPDVMIRKSALAKYLSLSSSNTGMLRCPSDNVEVHQPNSLTNPPSPYPYSYVMNCFIAGSSSASNPTFASKFTSYAGGAGSPAPLPTVCQSLHKVKNPSQKALMYEQAEVAWPAGPPAPGIDDGDGCPWYGSSAVPPTAINATCGGNIDLLSIRHDPQRADTTGEKSQAGTYAQAVPFANFRGNVVFCDGHVDFVARSYLHLPEHTLGTY